jgi:uncharacterized surface protein with fasciclin (FAS1) repeats
MRLFYLNFLFPRALAEVSQGLFVSLAEHSELNDLVTQIKSFPRLYQALSSADNFTFIAPTNGALSTWLSTNRSQDLLEATLTYHLLQGTYASTSLKDHPKIIPTALTNTSFTNVTAGQRVKAYNNGHVIIESGLKNSSNVITPVSLYSTQPLPSNTYLPRTYPPSEASSISSTQSSKSPSTSSPLSLAQT